MLKLVFLHRFVILILFFIVHQAYIIQYTISTFVKEKKKFEIFYVTILIDSKNI